MTADQYLSGTLVHEALNTCIGSPVLTAQNTLLPVFREWGGHYLQDVHPSGSFPKGTANHSGADIALFVTVA